MSSCLEPVVKESLHIRLQLPNLVFVQVSLTEHGVPSVCTTGVGRGRGGEGREGKDEREGRGGGGGKGKGGEEGTEGAGRIKGGRGGGRR